ncbi:MAG: FKBP-type peptidyl-prolyl cis-trans isomerase [Fibrobacterota bacterium]
MKNVIWIVVVVLAFAGGYYLSQMTPVKGGVTGEGEQSVPGSAASESSSEESGESLLRDIEVLGNDTESFSYSLGYGFGKSLDQVKDRVDISVLLSAVKAAMEGDEPLIGRQEAQQIQRKVMTEQKKEASAKQQKRASEGKSFLENNKKQDGVVETESGLQYKVMKEGTGEKPGPEDKVRVHYTGKLLDGEIFDSSVERGKPVTFSLDRVIKGWSEGLQLMKEGAKYTLYIPSELAYGEKGASPKIGPNETLIFEVELLEILTDTEEDSSKK